MVQIAIEVKGLKELEASLDKTGRGVMNLRQPMTDVGRYLTSFFSGEVFASRGGVIGQPWKPLNASYATHKAARWPGRPPLVQTGKMMRSFQSNPAATQVLIFNSDKEKFMRHQLGTRKMPARVMMAIDQTRTQRIVNIIGDYVGRLLKEAK